MKDRSLFKSNPCRFYATLFVLWACGISFFWGCDRLGLSTGPVVLVVGDQRLTADILKQDMDFASEGLPIATEDAEKTKKILLDQVIDRYLILEYARRKGINVSDEEFDKHLMDIMEGYTKDLFDQTLLQKWGDPDAWLRRFKEELVIEKAIGSIILEAGTPDYKEIKAHFESDPNHFKVPERVKFRQIFCRTRKEANEIRAKIRAGEDLAALARTISEDPEGKNGGEVGWIEKGTLDEPIDKMLFKMAPGDTSPVIKGPSGYHIFEVLDRRPEGFPAFSEVISEIEEALLRKRRASLYKRWLKRLRTEIKIKIHQKAIDQLEFS